MAPVHPEHPVRWVNGLTFALHFRSRELEQWQWLMQVEPSQTFQFVPARIASG